MWSNCRFFYRTDTAWRSWLLYKIHSIRKQPHHIDCLQREWNSHRPSAWKSEEIKLLFYCAIQKRRLTQNQRNQNPTRRFALTFRRDVFAQNRARVKKTSKNSRIHMSLGAHISPQVSSLMLLCSLYNSQR